MIVLPMTRGMLGQAPAPPGPIDPDFGSVVQLAHFDGANGSTTLTNSCPRGNALVAQGTTALSTTEKKWGTASLRVNGGTEGATNIHADYAFGLAAFTVEFWLWLDSSTTTYNLMYFNSSGTLGMYILNPGKLHFYYSGNQIVTANNVLVANTWQFIQYVRSGTTGTLYVDGTSVGSWSDNVNYGASDLWVGGFGGGQSLAGYIDDLRITNGVARANAVPVAPFPDS